jgi:hypothetical protein
MMDERDIVGLDLLGPLISYQPNGEEGETLLIGEDEDHVYIGGPVLRGPSPTFDDPPPQPEEPPQPPRAQLILHRPLIKLPKTLRMYRSQNRQFFLGALNIKNNGPRLLTYRVRGCP